MNFYELLGQLKGLLQTLLGVNIYRGILRP